MKHWLSIALFTASCQLLAAPAFLEKPPQLCPEIYRPAVCTYRDLQAAGQNACFARHVLEKELKKMNLDYEAQDIICKYED